MTFFRNLADLFQQVLNMSLTASLVIVAICVARLALKRAPKKFSYCLWLAAGFRLVCPFSIPAVFSLFALTPTQTVSSRGPLTQVGYLPGPSLSGGVGGGQAPAAPLAGGQPAPALAPLEILALVWMLGVLTMLALAAASTLRVKRQVATAVKFAHNVYQCGQLRSPFVLGFFRPKIYIPFGLAPRQQEYVLCHEGVHVKRRDYLVKPLAFLLLAAHWFNPLVWVAFHLLDKDMEMSCDEKVLSLLGEEARRDYSLSLLSIGSNRRLAFPDPLAFGETGVKERVKNVMKFHKTKTWVTLIAAVAAVAVTAACAANPAGESLLSSSSPASSESPGSTGGASSSGTADEIGQRLEEVLTAWLDQPDETLVELSTPGEKPATQEVLDAMEQEINARFEELFPGEYFTETGYESLRAVVLQAVRFHTAVGDGTMEFAGLEPNETEPENSSWQWVATARVSRPGEEEQDIPLRVSVQEEGNRIASLRLYREDVTQVYAYFGSDPFLAMESAAQEQQAELEAEMQDAFDKMQSSQEEIDRLEEEQEEGAAVSSQLEEAQSQWQAEFDRYDDALGQAYEDGDTAESSAVSRPEATATPPPPQETPEADVTALGQAVFQEQLDRMGIAPLETAASQPTIYNQDEDTIQFGMGFYYRPEDTEDTMQWLPGNTWYADGEYAGWLKCSRVMTAELQDGQWTVTQVGTGAVPTPWPQT